MNALQIEGTIKTYVRVESFDAAKALIRRIIPVSEPAYVWIQRVEVDHYDITTYGEPLPNYIQGGFEIGFRVGLLLEEEGS